MCFFFLWGCANWMKASSPKPTPLQFFWGLLPLLWIFLYSFKPHNSRPSVEFVILFEPIKHLKFTLRTTRLHFLAFTIGSILCKRKSVFHVCIHLVFFLFQILFGKIVPWFKCICSRWDNMGYHICFSFYLVCFLEIFYSTEINKIQSVYFFV